MSKTNNRILCIVSTCKVMMMYEISVADPEGPLLGGVTKSARSAAGGGCGRGIPPPSGKFFFLKNGCKWCIMSPFFAEFVSIFSPKIVCNFCLQSSDLRYVMRENFRAVWGARVSPRKFLKNGCKWCILSPFLPSSCRFFSPKNDFKSPIIYVMWENFHLSC